MNIVAKIARQTAVALCAASLLTQAFIAPVLAEHVIYTLGTQPVLGKLTSTQDLQRQTVAQRYVFESAAQMMGLTRSQTHVLESRIANKQLRYGLVPRHLEVSTGKEAGRVFLERDVLIPANTYGWEIDIPDGNQIIAVYIPAVCGNLSLVHRSAPPACPHGLNGTDPNCFAPTCPQGMQGTPPNCAVPVCPAGMVGTPPNCSAPPTPAPPAPVPSPAATPPPPPPQHKAAVLWPLLLLGGLLIHGGSGGPPPPPSCP